MDKIGYIIVGVPKCGQSSLIKYTKRNDSNILVKKDEVIWNKEGPKIFMEKYGYNKSIKPVIILRDPIERIWSAYWYFHFTGEKPFRELYTYEQFLHIKRYDFHLGEMNPISGSNYNKWIKMWQPLNPIIHHLEQLRKDPEFPHLNKIETARSEIKRPEMTKEQYELTKNLLDNEVETYKSPIWSTDPTWNV